jgi:uncharacterized protein (DUF2344 family)
VVAVRLVYSAGGLFRFLSHLDIAEELARLVSRAGIDTHYSEGFNPRPKMSLCPPKPVGVSVCADIADIALDSLDLKPEAAIDEGNPHHSFPGARDAVFDRAAQRYHFPDDTSAAPADTSTAYPSESCPVLAIADAEWFAGAARAFDDAIAADAMSAHSSAATLALFDRLRARVSPQFDIRAMRILDESESSSTRAIHSAVYFIRLEHSTIERARDAARWLASDRWLIVKKPGGTEVDVRPLVRRIGVGMDDNAVIMGLIAGSHSNETLPIMKVMGRLVHEFDSIPTNVIRVGFHDAAGRVCL